MEVEIATYEIIPEWLHCNRISWFAVFEKYRCRGVGSTLLEYAINELGNDKVIEVTTFQESYSEGIPARRAYQKFGFVDYDLTVQMNGYPRSLMKRIPEKLSE
jgi:GNAT superfamily N-acetyltransferase